MHHLDDEARALLELVRSFASERVAPRAEEGERTGRFPRELFDQLGSMDLAGLPFRVEDGGSGVPFGVYLQVVEELSRAWLTLGLSLSVHTLATWAVATFGSETVRAHVLPRLVAGEWLGAYALSEPGSGSDAAALTTRALPDGDGWRLTGTKAWVTHQGMADCYVVMARTGGPGANGISAFLVPSTAEGLAFPARERKMGMAASPTGQVLLTDVRVPAEFLLGEADKGFHIAMRALDGGRLGIAACALGLGQAALDAARAYAREREQFGRPIADFQGIAFMLADMVTGLEAARALTGSAASRRDAGEPFGLHAAMAKLFATDTVMRIATDAVQVHGGYGYTTDYAVERYLREAKVLQIVEGTNQVQRMVIARALNG